MAADRVQQFSLILAFGEAARGVYILGEPGPSLQICESADVGFMGRAHPVLSILVILADVLVFCC